MNDYQFNIGNIKVFLVMSQSNKVIESAYFRIRQGKIEKTHVTNHFLFGKVLRYIGYDNKLICYQTVDPIKL